MCSIIVQAHSCFNIHLLICGKYTFCKDLQLLSLEAAKTSRGFLNL